MCSPVCPLVPAPGASSGAWEGRRSKVLSNETSAVSHAIDAHAFCSSCRAGDGRYSGRPAATASRPVLLAREIAYLAWRPVRQFPEAAQRLRTRGGGIDAEPASNVTADAESASSVTASPAWPPLCQAS